MYCPTCHAALESASQRFCQTCGASLGAGQPRAEDETRRSPWGTTNPITLLSGSRSLESLGDRVNRALATRNTGQLVVYAGAALLAVMLVSAVVHIVLSLLPLFIFAALFIYFRRHHRSRHYRRW
jgi:Flp pilus assembly protein TadB